MDVRIGAIYILERIARDSAEDHPPVMEILCSLVRRRTGKPNESTNKADTLIRPPDFDVQAALTVLARRDPTRDRTPISLVGANLAGAHLESAHLRHADLRFTDLREAHLHGADLHEAFLFKANLAGAYLHGANASQANLRWANMEHVWANRTDFQHAIFWGADLQRADLHQADLRNADLSTKETTLVTPPDSEFSMTHLKGPYPDGWTVSSHSFPGVKVDQAILLGAQLQEANLQGVEGLTREQLNSTAGHTKRYLPEHLRETTDES